MTIARSQSIQSWRDLPWGAIRLAVVVGGGLLVLQSSPDLDAPKLAYLAVAGIAFAGSLRSVTVGPARALARTYLHILISVAVFSVVLAGSFVVSAINGTRTIDWVRDVVGYALFAAVPVLAIDAAATTSKRFLIGFLTVVGLLASLSWAVEWLQRRLIIDLPFDRLLLPAGQVAVALYAFALAAAIKRRDIPLAWAATAGIVLGLFLVTGTRSSIVLLVIPLAIWLAARPREIGHGTRVVGIHLVAALAIFAVVQLALEPAPDAPVASPSPGGAVGSPGGGAASPVAVATPSPEAPSALDRFLSIEALANDPSFKERAAQYGAAWDLFLSSPVVGVGPGHPIEWTDVSGLPRDDFFADTPLVFPAKFGLVGIEALGFVVVSYVRLFVGVVKRGGWTAEALGLCGYGLVTSVGLPLGMPIEDKSFGFALLLLVALALSASHDPLMATAQPASQRTER